ncbi:LCP family protein [Helcococcus sueciensis]|uniref:LCP family protein n=1 Tax=Helcococcus sueciensis TaxID=241555 RepID=UPI0003FC6DE0|nr:LCP family protein [Helcococcus sueciensis]
MNEEKSIISNIFFVLSTISLVLFASQLFVNELLPSKYRFILIMFLVLMHLIFGFLVIKYSQKKILNIVLSIILGLLILIQSVGAFYIYRTYSKFNSKIAESETKKVSYSIITLKNNHNVDTVVDMKSATIYYDKHENKEDIDLLRSETDKINKKLKYVEGKGAIPLANDLLEGKIKYMILNESKLSHILESISEFDHAYKIIKFTSDPNESKFEIEKNKITQAKDVKHGESFNVFISGGDSYGGLEDDLRSDVNIVVTINPEKDKVLITQIPRDSYVMMRDLGYDKLTHAGSYGVETLIGTVEDLLDTDINYYVKVNFNSLEDIVDALGGINVSNNYEFVSRTKQFYFPAGNIDLNGEEALEFVRERYSLPNGEFDRGKNQIKVLTAIINKTLSPSIIFNYTSVLDTVLDSISTNLPSKKITELLNEQVESMKKWTIESYQVEGEPVWGLPSYAMPGYELSFVQLYDDEIIDAINKIKNVLGDNTEEFIEEIEETEEFLDENNEYYEE